MNRKLADKSNGTFHRGIIAVAGMALLALLCGASWYYRYQEDQYSRVVMDQLSAIGRLKAHQIMDWRHERFGDASVISESPFLRQAVISLLTNPDKKRAAQMRIRFASLATHYNYSDVLLVDREGRIRLGLGQHRSLLPGYKTPLNEAFYKGTPVFSDLHADRKHQTPHLSVAAPFFTGEGRERKPIGAIILISDASQFLYPLIQTWPTPSKSAETLLVARDGNNALILNDLRHTKDTALKMRIPLNRTDIIAVMAVLGKQGIVTGRDYRGTEVMAALTKVSGFPWYMVAKVDRKELYADWRARSFQFMLLFLALTGGIAAMALAFWQRHKKDQYLALYQAESDLRASVQRHKITLEAIGDAVIATDPLGQVEFLNPVAETLTGWSQSEAAGRPLAEVFRIINKESRESVEEPVTRVLREETVVGLANHTLLIARDGREIPIADSAAPIRDDSGMITGVVLVFRDQTEEKRAHQLLQTRLNLLEYATTHALEDLLTRTLDEAGNLLQSPIGFYHFVDSDQQSLTLQQWSTRTRREFCRAGGRGMHYPIAQAGVWVDCIREAKPVIHNDYASLPHKKGLPPGHAEVIRELLVPVMREGKIVAIIGVGNKPADYTDEDVETIAYLADITWNIIEQKRMEERLRENEAFLNTLFEAIPLPLYHKDREGLYRGFNRAFEAFLGITREKAIGKTVFQINPPELAGTYHTRDLELFERGGIQQYEFQIRNAQGELRDVIFSKAPLRDSHGNINGLIGAIIDISERKRAEEEREKLHVQLNQAQKMESVGRLAGGVAHDFNNMLGVIIGHTELALMKSDPHQSHYSNLQAIHKAAEHSADLTRQLLAFARKQAIAPTELDMNETVQGMLNVLERLIGEDIELAWIPGRGVWPVRMDPGQINQILTNLCVNARDAITGVGTVTIETSNARIDENYCSSHPEFIEGEFVRLAISDSGSGMDRETLDNIFDPFFTTKGAGKGTGLGLATVYGIVKQSNGFINVYSEPGQGTTFKIYLPRHIPVSGQPEKTAPESISHGHETVLLVEDQPEILEVGRTLLEKLGYTVLTAGTPGDAINAAMEHDGRINLLLTDVIMPGMNGRELSGKIMALYPEITTLFMSGYTADVISHRGVLDEGVYFIHKPFSLQDLAKKVRESLEGK